MFVVAALLLLPDHRNFGVHGRPDSTVEAVIDYRVSLDILGA
jgi:hypothetical protein